MDYRCQHCGRKLDTGLRCPVCDAKKSESMPYCKDCEYFFKRGGNTYCSALPVVEEIYRYFGCIYFKQKENKRS